MLRSVAKFMRFRALPALSGATLLYGILAFYSLLTVLYFAFGLYSLTVLPDKSALFAMPIPLPVGLRLGLAIVLAAAGAVALTRLRTTPRLALAAPVFLVTLFLLALNLAGYQQHHLTDRISLLVTVLVVSPAFAVTVWTGISTERHVRLFSRTAA